MPALNDGFEVSPLTIKFEISETLTVVPEVFAANIDANSAADILTFIEPDKSSRKVGELTVIVGFEPKLDPKSKELPATYKEF